MRDAPFVSAYWTPETTDNFTLGIFGNANEDVPLTYEERDEGSKKPATNLAADANYDGVINRLDAEQAKLIIQGIGAYDWNYHHPQAKVVTVHRPVK